MRGAEFDFARAEDKDAASEARIRQLAQVYRAKAQRNGASEIALGAIDDKRGTSALAKFTAQVFIAGVLVLTGVQLLYFWLPWFGIVSIGSDLGVPLTILWVVLVARSLEPPSPYPFPRGSGEW